MKLGVHTQVLDGPLEDYLAVARPSFWKSLTHDPQTYARILARVPGLRIVARLPIPIDGWEQNPVAAGERFAERCLSQEVTRQNLIWAWEVPNETLGDSTNFRLWDLFQDSFRNTLVASSHCEAIAFCAGEGNLDEQTASHFPLTTSKYRYYGFHEYDWPTLSKSHLEGIAAGNGGCWRALRYRRVMKGVLAVRPDALALVTECGLTQAVYGGPDLGYLTAKNPDQYWGEDLDWYDSEIEQDSFLLAALVFQFGGDSAWPTFEIKGSSVVGKIAWTDRDRSRCESEIAGSHTEPADVVYAREGSATRMKLSNFPIVNQLPPGNDDPNAYNDCGEACIRATGLYLGMASAKAETLRQIKTDETGDWNYLGYTTTDETTTWFTRQGISSYQSQPSDVPASIVSQLKLGYPIIYLSYWNLEKKTGGHFRVSTDFDELAKTIMFMNPWGGFFETWTYDDVRNNSLGQWIVVVQKTAPIQGVPPVNPSLQAAAAANFSMANAAIVPNQDGAIFKAYVRKYKVYVDSGYDDVLNPTPAITDEWSDGKDSYQMFDSGEVYHWSLKDGLVRIAERKELSAILKKTSWKV